MLTREQLLDALGELIAFSEKPDTTPQTRARIDRIIQCLRDNLDTETVDPASFWYSCIGLIHALEPPNPE